jgi:Uma2 family endonuclease
MKARSAAKATYEDLLKVPENLIAELIDGELYTWPRPAGPHARFSSVLGMEIGPPYDLGRNGPGGWWILDEPELHLGKNVLVPDLAGWRRERMPKIPSDQRFVIEPDWVCEMITTASAAVVRAKKSRIYAKCGVPWLWLVDPEYRVLEPYKLIDGFWTTRCAFTGDDVFRADPFPEAEIDLASIWGPTPEEFRVDIHAKNASVELTS